MILSNISMLSFVLCILAFCGHKSEAYFITVRSDSTKFSRINQIESLYFNLPYAFITEYYYLKLLIG